MFVSFHTSFFFSFFSCPSFNSQFYPCYYSPRSTAFLLSSFCPMTFPFVLFTTFLFFPSSVPLPMLLPDPVFTIISLFFLKSATFQYNPSLLPFSLYFFLLMLAPSYLLSCLSLPDPIFFVYLSFSLSLSVVAVFSIPLFLLLLKNL
jgi:hypothetical protein